MTQHSNTKVYEWISSSFLLAIFSFVFSNSYANVPLHEWTSSKEHLIFHVNDNGENETIIPENLTTWVFEDGTFIPMAKLQGEKSYSIITDHLGTPTEAFDSEGKKVWSRQLNIYGETRKETGVENFIPFLYQVQYLDTETKLAYNRFRYYSPESGTYVSQDPIRLSGGIQFYSYVHDINSWIDPLGWIEIIRTMSGAEAGLTASNKGLVRGPNNSRGAKWVSSGVDYDTARASNHKVVFDMDDSAEAFLKSDNLDYEDMVGGEKGNMNKILTKGNEKGALGIGVDKLDDFNSKIKKITIFKKDKKDKKDKKGKWKKVKTIKC